MLLPLLYIFIVVARDAGVEGGAAFMLDGDDVEWGVPVGALGEGCESEAVDWRASGS